ncbi:MAG: hypothetical protein ABI333_06580 [bacterium]
MADLREGIDCLLDQGTAGCVFRQPLEAMRRALDDHPDNAGFLRSSAVLSVIVVSSTDDCSAADDRLFDPAETALDSELGPLTPFRCFEFGSTCDVTDRSVAGSWGVCRVNENPEGLLTPVSNYLTFLDSIKLRERRTLTAVTGVESGWPFFGEVNVGHDASGFPQLNPMCVPSGVHVTFAPRLLHLVDELHDPTNDRWPLQSICHQGWLEGLDYEIGDRVDTDCPFWYPIAGCRDIGAAVGQPADAQSCNDLCRPLCTVREAYYHATPEEYRLDVPHCLEVCPDGLCAGNDDPTQAYADGAPPDRDPALPVPSCWYLYYNPQCTDSAFATIQIARREDPPRLTVAAVDCAWAMGMSQEFLCNNGRDDDEDCLVDCDDPDCAQDPSCTE